MFRKIAIALVAASVFTAPVLAQVSTTPSEGKTSQTTPAPNVSSAEKTDKAVTSAPKHRTAVRHHRHGGKMAKYTKSHGTKMAKSAKAGSKYGKYARHMSRTRTAPKHAYGATSMKSISPKAAGKPSSTKPAAKPSPY